MDGQLPRTGRITERSGPSISEVQTPSRLTVVETVSYYTASGQPFVLQSRFGRAQSTEEQAFQRHLKIGPEWTPLDVGWIKVCGMLILQNREGKSLQRIPTPEELADVNARVIEVCVRPVIIKGNEDERRDMHSPAPVKTVTTYTADLLLPPGESMRVLPNDLSKFMVRCAHGEAKLVINIIPG